MVLAIVVDHLGDCPAGDKGVGCENGTHAVRILVFAKWKCHSIDGRVLVVTWWWAGVNERIGLYLISYLIVNPTKASTGL